MTKEQLCALALQAIEDADARVVLDDFLQESTWWGDNFHHIMKVDGYRWREHGATASCVAAVLLFGDWPTRWELAERCEVRVAWRLDHVLGGWVAGPTR